jgi:hypothetical protein
MATRTSTVQREEEKRANVRRLLNSLEAGGEAVYLPREEYILSSVRATASALTGDTGKKFNVSLQGAFISLKRTS